MANSFLPNPTFIQMAKGPARKQSCSQIPLQLEQSHDSVLSDELEVEVSCGEHSFPLPPKSKCVRKGVFVISFCLYFQPHLFFLSFWNVVLMAGGHTEQQGGLALGLLNLAAAHLAEK